MEVKKEKGSESKKEKRAESKKEKRTESKKGKRTQKKNEKGLEIVQQKGFVLKKEWEIKKEKGLEIKKEKGLEMIKEKGSEMINDKGLEVIKEKGFVLKKEWEIKKEKEDDDVIIDEIGDTLFDGTKSSLKHKIKVQQDTENPTGKTEQGRRRKFFKKKKSVYKAPRAISVPIAANRVFYRGSYFAKGDIVSVVDDQARVYYAQIRGLLQDQYCEKSAVITWLIPTQGSPKGRFDPATYIIGPEEEIPRALDCFEFVCHSPNAYYYLENPHHPEVQEQPVCGFAYTSKGPKIVSLPAEEFNTDSE